ncbi:MAG: DUF6350 family protein [Propionibacteriales bacterium]|nr:DUF6350 family protein [Propionibacteriales bacterium]
MAPLFSRRSGARTARSRSDGMRRPGPTAGADEDPVTEPVLGWIPAAVGAALVSALATWILTAGVAILGWLPGVTGSVGETLAFGSRMWLLGHFGGIRVGAAPWTLVPLGLTLIIVICLRATAAFAARQAYQAHRLRTGPAEPDGRTQVRLVGRVVAVQSGVYALVVLAVGLSAPGTAIGRAVVGALVLAVLATAIGALAGVRARLVDLLPAWARAVPRAVGTAQLVMLIGAAGALAATLLQQYERVTALSSSAGAPVTGVIALTVLQLAYLPNLLLWTGSWTLAAGFTLGDGSLVSPVQTQLGLLPAIPVLGGLPAEGVGQRALLCWLLVGVAAGVLAAVVVMRGRRAARFEERSLVGGLAGILSGLVFVVLALLSGGDLGSNRLTGLGPRPSELFLMAPLVMGLSAMVAGMIGGLVRMVGGRKPDRPKPGTSRRTTKERAGGDSDPDQEPTVVLD